MPLREVCQRLKGRGLRSRRPGITGQHRAPLSPVVAREWRWIDRRGELGDCGGKRADLFGQDRIVHYRVVRLAQAIQECLQRGLTSSEQELVTWAFPCD